MGSRGLGWMQMLSKAVCSFDNKAMLSISEKISFLGQVSFLYIVQQPWKSDPPLPLSDSTAAVHWQWTLGLAIALVLLLQGLLAHCLPLRPKLSAGTPHTELHSSGASVCFSQSSSLCLFLLPTKHKGLYTHFWSFWRSHTASVLQFIEIGMILNLMTSVWGQLYVSSICTAHFSM